MSNGSNDRAVVQAIINLGKAMGLTVTAEGVETLEQLDFLISDQCHEVQGFYLSRPVDRYALLPLLKASVGRSPAVSLAPLVACFIRRGNCRGAPRSQLDTAPSVASVGS